MKKSYSNNLNFTPKPQTHDSKWIVDGTKQFLELIKLLQLKKDIIQISAVTVIYLFFLTTVSLRSSSVSFFNPQNKNLMKILKAERISDKAAVII